MLVIVIDTMTRWLYTVTCNIGTFVCSAVTHDDFCESNYSEKRESAGA